MKKVIVTGHTSGLGLHIYNHFNNKEGYTVIGLSRSNGYDIEKDIEKVIQFIKNEKPDYFFNNVYYRTTQSKFIEQLAPDTIVITSGSMAADSKYQPINSYDNHKHIIEQTHKQIKKNGGAGAHGHIIFTEKLSESKREHAAIRDFVLQDLATYINIYD
jgi:NADP-dependent 3-hydroxy acid dehydrogenase YdfG